MISSQWHQALMLSASLGIGPCAGLAGAQQATPPQPPPSRALYRGDQQDRTNGQFVMLNGSVFESYDDNVVGNEQGVSPTDPRYQTSGYFTRADAGIFYGRRTNKLTWTSNAGTGVNFYPGLNNLTQSSYNANSDLSVQLGRSSRLVISGNASYVPYFFFSAFPTFTNPDSALTQVSGLAASQDLALVTKPVRFYGAGVRFTQPVSRRASLDLNYSSHISRFGGAWTDQTEQSAGARLNFPLSRRTTFNVGYSYDTARYVLVLALVPVTPTRFKSQNVDVGLAYARALSPTRRLSLSGAIGSSIMDRRPLLLQGGKKYYYQVSGSSSVTYEFSRAWSARGEFRRSLQFLEGLPAPFFSNSFSSSLQGLIGRRLGIQGTGSFSHSLVGIEALVKGYDTGAGSVRFQYGLTRLVAVSTEYVYYKYDFTHSAGLPPGVSRTLSRQVIRAGISVGVPLMHQPARP